MPCKSHLGDGGDCQQSQGEIRQLQEERGHEIGGSRNLEPAVIGNHGDMGPQGLQLVTIARLATAHICRAGHLLLVQGHMLASKLDNQAE